MIPDSPEQPDFVIAGCAGRGMIRSACHQEYRWTCSCQLYIAHARLQRDILRIGYLRIPVLEFLYEYGENVVSHVTCESRCA